MDKTFTITLNGFYMRDKSPTDPSGAFMIVTAALVKYHDGCLLFFNEQGFLVRACAAGTWYFMSDETQTVKNEYAVAS